MSRCHATTNYANYFLMRTNEAVIFMIGPANFLLVARKVDLRRISLDTHDLHDVLLPVSGVRQAAAIDFDPVDKFVYWSDNEALEIKRCRMDGKGT